MSATPRRTDGTTTTSRRRRGALVAGAGLLVAAAAVSAAGVGLTGAAAPAAHAAGPHARSAVLPDNVLEGAHARKVNGNPGLDTGLKVKGKHLLLDCYPCTGGKLGGVEIAAMIPDHHKGVDTDHYTAPHGPYVEGSAIWYHDGKPGSGSWAAARVRDSHDRVTGQTVVYATLPRGASNPVTRPVEDGGGLVRMAVTPAPWDHDRLLAVSVLGTLDAPVGQVTYRGADGHRHRLVKALN